MTAYWQDLMRKVVVLVATAVSFLSCAKPATMEQFVPTRDCTENGVYRMEVDMSEEAFYDLSLFLCLDCPALKLNEFVSMPFTIEMVSPSGKSYSGELATVKGGLHSNSYFSHQLTAFTGSGVVPVESGVWQMILRIAPENIEEYAVSGIGMKIDVNRTK